MNIIQQMQQALERLQSEGVLTAYLGDSDEAMEAKRAARAVLAKSKEPGNADASMLDAAPALRDTLQAIIPDLEHELTHIAARLNPDNAAAVTGALREKLAAARSALLKAAPTT